MGILTEIAPLQKFSFRTSSRLADAIHEHCATTGVSRLHLIAKAIESVHNDRDEAMAEAVKDASPQGRRNFDRYWHELITFGAQKRKSKGTLPVVVGTLISNKTLAQLQSLAPRQRVRGRVVNAAVARHLSRQGFSTVRYDERKISRFALALKEDLQEEIVSALEVVDHGWSHSPIEVIRRTRGLHVVLTPAFLLTVFSSSLNSRALLKQIFGNSVSVILTSDTLIRFADVAERVLPAEQIQIPEIKGCGPEMTRGAEMAMRIENLMGCGVEFVQVTPEDVAKSLRVGGYTKPVCEAVFREKKVKKIVEMEAYWNKEIQYRACFYYDFTPPEVPADPVAACEPSLLEDLCEFQI